MGALELRSDFEKARTHLEYAATQTTNLSQQALAKVELAELLQGGHGGVLDVDRARLLINEASEQDYNKSAKAMAIFNRAQMILRRNEDQAFEKVRDLLGSAAFQNDNKMVKAKAQAFLGMTYKTTYGTLLKCSAQRTRL